MSLGVWQLNHVIPHPREEGSKTPRRWNALLSVLPLFRAYILQPLHISIFMDDSIKLQTPITCDESHSQTRNRLPTNTRERQSHIIQPGRSFGRLWQYWDSDKCLWHRDTIFVPSQTFIFIRFFLRCEGVVVSFRILRLRYFSYNNKHLISLLFAHLVTHKKPQLQLVVHCANQTTPRQQLCNQPYQNLSI